jgi:hypothetical protein
MRVMSFPFSFASADGQAATVEQGSDVWMAQCIASVVLTVPGERVLAPAFGLPDPTFSGFSYAALALAMSTYYPQINLSGASITTGATGAQVEVNFNAIA